MTRPSRLYVMDKKPGYNTMVVTDTIRVACSNMAIHGDSLYYYATEWNNYTASNTISYGIIDVRTKQVVSTNFITDGTDKDITIPYGIAIHPETGDIFVTDAKTMSAAGHSTASLATAAKMECPHRRHSGPHHISQNTLTP